MAYWIIKEFEDFFDKKGIPYRNKFPSQIQEKSSNNITKKYEDI